MNWMVAGSTPSCPTKITWSTSPTENAGIEIPPMLRKRMAPSSRPPERREAGAPRAMPRMVAIVMASAIELERHQQVPARRSGSTGCLEASEFPKSPRTTLVT